MDSSVPAESSAKMVETLRQIFILADRLTSNYNDHPNSSSCWSGDQQGLKELL